MEFLTQHNLIVFGLGVLAVLLYQRMQQRQAQQPDVLAELLKRLQPTQPLAVPVQQTSGGTQPAQVSMAFAPDQTIRIANGEVHVSPHQK